nr:glycosyltransferase family 4 protein [Deinococcus aestuarii]
MIIVENLPVPFDRRVWMEATTLRDAGYSVSVICPVGREHTAPFEVIDGIAVYRHPQPPEGHRGLDFVREYAVALAHEMRLAWRVRRERGFDVIHACNPPDLIFLVALPFKLLFGTRFIFDQHDVNPEVYLAKFGRRDLPYRGLLIAERLTYALADVVISTNESFKRLALRRGGKRPEDVFVVRSGPRLDRFRPRPGGEHHRAGFRYLVGYVGVIGAQDGLDYLLRVARLIVDSGRTDIKFMIIGGGTSLEELRVMCTRMGLDPYVEFTGMVTDQAELLERLTACDLCVGPDPKNPMNDISTMNKVLEYMALGKPIVQFDLTEGRYSAGDASVYARPNEETDFAAKILDLLADPKRRARMGEIGQERMRRALSWEYQVPQLEAAYARALSKRQPGRPGQAPVGERKPPAT